MKEGRPFHLLYWPQRRQYCFDLWEGSVVCHNGHKSVFLLLLELL